MVAYILAYFIRKTASVDNYKVVSAEFSSILLQQYYPNRTPKMKASINSVKKPSSLEVTSRGVDFSCLTELRS